MDSTISTCQPNGLRTGPSTWPVSAAEHEIFDRAGQLAPSEQAEVAARPPGPGVGRKLSRQIAERLPRTGFFGHGASFFFAFTEHVPHPSLLRLFVAPTVALEISLDFSGQRCPVADELVCHDGR